VGTDGGQVFDMDLDEAVAVKKVFDESTYELTKILSI
jgi:hypothetical protein